MIKRIAPPIDRGFEGRPVTPRAMTGESLTADDCSRFSARFFSPVRSSVRSRR